MFQKKILVSSVLVPLVAAGLLQILSAATSVNLTGAWNITSTATSGGGAAVTSLAAFGSDGGVTSSSTILNAVSGSLPRGASITAAHGGWTNSAPGLFSATYEADLSAGGNFIGFLRSRQTIRLDSSGTTFTGNFVTELMIPGEPTVQLQSGTITGTQIVVVPLPVGFNPRSR